MKIKQKLLIVSALSCAAVAAVGFLANANKKQEPKAILNADDNENNEVDTKE